MISIDLKSLVKKMSPYLRDSLEGAAGICLSQGQFNVELEHWLLKLLDKTDTDIYQLLITHEVNPSTLAKQLATSIAQFKAGSSRPAALSPSIVEAAKNAWMLASVDFGQQTITSGHLFAALLLDDTLKRQVTDSCSELALIAAESLRNNARDIYGQTDESKRAAAQSITSNAPGQPAALTNSKTPTLDKYTIDLTAKAKTNKMDPVLGRDEEIRQCMDILTRRRQNNPILTGEAGVGKTAVVEGLAQRIVQGDVPSALKNITLRTLDLGLLQAGASVKGEFENRLKSVIEEVQSSPTPIILFIDEAHTLIGAGGKEGQGDAANLLKPALARGELRTIAATTWAEYKKYFERDPALTRRFQVVKVEEPSEERAIDMMRGVAESLEKHHKVRILEEAIVASVKLSHRYIPGRQLPDKSVSLLDTACARVALNHTATPYPLEDARRRIERADTAINALEKERLVTGQHTEQIEALQVKKAEAEADLARLTEQFNQEHTLVEEIRAIYDAINASTANSEIEAPQNVQQKITELSAALKEVQGQQPLLHPHVDAQAVAEIIANWTGIPVGKMVSNEIHAVQTLAERLNKRVIGQNHALQAVAQAIQTARAGLTDPRKPMGVFLFCGTRGVGKTETALALPDELFGGEQNITTINMSEFKEEHKVSMLLGSPPGYVGYGEGGVLTEAARRKPYSVILLDEMEKAHPGVQDIFYNLFDKGTIKDGEGRDIDFKNTLIIMTSNAGEDAIRAIFSQVEEKPEPDVLLDNIRPQLLNYFKPAFLGRTNVITYFPLDDENLIKICAINMRRIEKRVKEHYGAQFTYDEDVLVNIVARCQEADTGARNIEGILNKTLLPALASQCLSRMASDEPIQKIHVGATEDGDFSYSFE